MYVNSGEVCCQLVMIHWQRAVAVGF